MMTNSGKTCRFTFEMADFRTESAPWCIPDTDVFTWFLPLIIFMRGVACTALLIDIIQLHFFVLQASMFNKMVWYSQFLIIFLFLLNRDGT
jgi:hypothetical protein